MRLSEWKPMIASANLSGEKPRRYDFLGAKFDPLSRKQVLGRIGQITTYDGFRYLVTPNVDHLVRLNAEPETYKPLYDGAWLSICDSRIVEMLAGFSAIHLKPFPGSDMTETVFRTVLKAGDSVNVIGADGEIISILRGKFPHITINHHQPPMGLRRKPDAVAQCADFIAAHPARFSFICVGSPQQEMVARACQDNKGCKGLGFCVGASLDFLSGKTRRAPLWMQRLRLEWLFRLLSEPKRLWKRYLLEGPKIFLIWLNWNLRKSGKAA